MNLKEHPIKKRLLAVVLIGLGIFSLVAGGSLVLLDLYSRQALHVEDGHLVRITQGMSVTQLAGLLAERQIIPSVRSFVVYVRVANWIDGATIKAGEYQLNANDTVADVVSRFQVGVVKQYRVTFPEGWTVSQWRSHIRSLRDLIIVDEAETRPSCRLSHRQQTISRKECFTRIPTISGEVTLRFRCCAVPITACSPCSLKNGHCAVKFH